ncbi:MAG: M28 family peptidase [Pirellula sp.]
MNFAPLSIPRPYNPLLLAIDRYLTTRITKRFFQLNEQNLIQLAGMLIATIGVAIAFTGEAAAEEPFGPIPTNDAQQRILADLKYLASDDLQGRAAETPGLRMGADYIANRWVSLGLRTDLFQGKPFQEFTLRPTPTIADPAHNVLKISKPNGETVSLVLVEQFQPQAIGRNGAFDANLVFAGYGISAKEAGIEYDDFSNVDVRGKVVIVIRKEPQQADPKSPFDGSNPSQFALFTAKQANAAKHGVAALIMINDAATENSSPDMVLPVAGSGVANSRDQVPTFFLKRSVVAGWLQEAGRSLAEIEMQIDQDLQPRSFELAGWKATGEADIENKGLPSMNVVGLLPGKGKLANEYVVIGAHFDHVGMGGAGSLAPGTIAIHNGADDNASGTTALMEAANKLVGIAKTDVSDQDRRSLVFIAFSGEERGLLGSIYYAEHPRFELENTVAMLNLDMVGRLTNNELVIYGTGTATEFDELVTQANSSQGFSIQRSPEGMGPSDHQSFFQKNIPVLHFFTGLHDDYHRPSDDFDKINLAGIDRITEMVAGIANKLSLDASKPSFVKVRGTANPRAARRPQPSLFKRIRLGVRFDLDGEGVVVVRVMENGAAIKAGILRDDKILMIEQDEITSRAELDRVLQKYKVGDTVTIWVERGSEKIELKAELTD